MSELDYLSLMALSFVFIESYLNANKLWSRKHDKNVAESISLTAKMISFVTITALIVDNYSKGYLQGVISSTVWLSLMSFQIAVGSGMWVRGVKNMGAISRFKLYILKESHELSRLIKGIINPASEELLVNIMAHVAMLDNELDINERKLIEKFSSNWGVGLDWGAIEGKRFANANTNIIAMRKMFTQYLDTSPPASQVIQFVELVKMVAHADGVVVASERAVIDEFSILAHSYVEKSDYMEVYDVAIVPQTNQQRESIPLLLTGLSHTKNHYGDIFVSSESFGKNYAQILCQEYRELGFVAIMIEPNSL